MCGRVRTAWNWLGTREIEMRQVRRVVALGVGVLATGALLAGGVSAQESSMPRMAWGAPDLSGVWDFRTITPLERPVALQG